MKQLLNKLEKNSIIKSVINSVSKNNGICVFGLSKKEKIFMSALFSVPVLYVCGNSADCEIARNSFEKMGKKVVAIDECDLDLCFHRFEFGGKTYQRLNACFKFLNNDFDVAVIPASVLFEPFFDIQSFKNAQQKYFVNQDIELETLQKTLIKSGYIKTNSVEDKGQFSQRGDVIDVFPVNSEVPFRLHFFDTIIEKITSFNIKTQYSICSHNEIEICPNGFTVEDISNIVTKLKNNITEENGFDEAINMLESGHIFASNYNFFAAFLKKSNLLDYLPSDTVIVFDEPKQCFDLSENFIDNSLKNIKQNIEVNFLLKEHLNVPFGFEEVKRKLEQKSLLSFQVITTQNKWFATKQVYSIDTMPLVRSGGKLELIKDEIKNFLKNGYLVLICCGDEVLANNVSARLKNLNIECNLLSSVSSVEKGVANVLPVDCELGAVFVQDKLVVYGKEQLSLIKNKKPKSQQNVKFSEKFTTPVSGELVVHAVHGVGICEGVQQLSINGYTKDYVVITYKNNDKLYVPTEQMDMLGRYVGAEKNPPLNQLGTTQFEKTKERVKASVKKLAIDLLQLEKERKSLKGIVLKKDKELQDEFASNFPFQTTPDQQKAIDDVENDLCSGKIMDRLVVGDVGYGKTEVALRGAFQTVMNGKQVAVLAPTTVLCEQHFAAFSARMQSFGLVVKCLNRFRTAKEQKQIIEELKQGKVNVICGTHRLLSKDVEFFDLGLLILDEEQRFGVADKEKIKLLKKNVHVLALSATPIPRTLHMALVGIRDISVIETPPTDRLPVQTIVSEYSPVLLSNAINRELERKGQALIVYPRIDTIDEFASKVGTMLQKDVTFAVAHGRMDKDKLENIILSVFSGEVQVLIATTLIENGLNLPNANTLFVVEADKLGLSQLYQLRGRVGRSDKLAFAYLTYTNESKLSDASYKRLSTLMEFTALGSGFKIAMRDLEIRGAGSLLGKEQHGQMEKVGYDMYCKLLDMAVSELKGIKIEEPKPVKLEVEINANIPKSLVSSEEDRMNLYLLISSIKNKSDFENVQEKIQDSWGILPESVLGLMKVAYLKSLCERHNIERFVLNANKVNAVTSLDNADNILKLCKITKLANCSVYNKNNMAIIDFGFKNINMQKKWDLVFKILEQ